MIKARAGDLVILGLSHENLRRLKEGRPINVKLREFGIDARLFIFAGATEAELRALQREFIPPDAGAYDHTRPSG